MEENDEDIEIISVIFDFGSQMSKAGFANDDCEWFPRCVFPTIIGRPRNPGIMIGYDAKDAYVGDEAVGKRGILRINFPVRYGQITEWNDFSKVLEHTFDYEIRICPKEEDYIRCNVLLASSVLTSESEIEKITQTLFEEYCVSKFQVLPQTLLTLFSFGKVSGCVLESGNDHTQCASIIEGEILKPELEEDQKYLYSHIAGSLVSEYFHTQIMERGFEFSTSGEREILRDIKEKMCYVSVDYESDVTKFNQAYPNLQTLKYEQFYENKEDVVVWPKSGKKDYKMEAYELPDGSHVCFGREKFEGTEILFDSSLDEKIVGRYYVSRRLSERNLLSFQELIYGSIMRSSKEGTERDFLFDNIYLGGGNTLFTGIEERLENEIRSLDDKITKISVTSHQKKWAGTEKEERNYGRFSAWIGGRVVSKLNSFSGCYVTKKEYEEIGPNVMKRKSLKDSLRSVIEHLMNIDGGSDLKERYEFVKENLEILACEGFYANVSVIGLEEITISKWMLL